MRVFPVPTLGPPNLSVLPGLPLRGRHYRVDDVLGIFAAGIFPGGAGNVPLACCDRLASTGRDLGWFFAGAVAVCFSCPRVVSAWPAVQFVCFSLDGLAANLAGPTGLGPSGAAQRRLFRGHVFLPRTLADDFYDVTALAVVLRMGTDCRAAHLHRRAGGGTVQCLVQSVELDGHVLSASDALYTDGRRHGLHDRRVLDSRRTPPPARFQEAEACAPLAERHLCHGCAAAGHRGGRGGQLDRGRWPPRRPDSACGGGCTRSSRPPHSCVCRWRTRRRAAHLHPGALVTRTPDQPAPHGVAHLSSGIS